MLICVIPISAIMVAESVGWGHNYSASIGVWIVLTIVLHPFLLEFGYISEDEESIATVSLTYETLEIESDQQFIDGTVEIDFELPDETNSYLISLELLASYQETEITDLGACDNFFVELIPKFDVNTSIPAVGQSLQNCENGGVELPLRPFFTSEPQEMSSHEFEQQYSTLYSSTNGHLTIRVSVDVERGHFASQDDGEEISLVLNGKLMDINNQDEGVA